MILIYIINICISILQNETFEMMLYNHMGENIQFFSYRFVLGSI